MTASRKLALVAATGAVTLVGGSPASATVDGEVSRSDVYSFGDPEASVGWSTLRRSDDGVMATFSANEVPAGHAVTLWWVVFNDPENCSAPGCGVDDFIVIGDPAMALNAEGIAAADIVGGYAGGTVASPDGHVLLSAGIDVDEIGPETIMGEGAVLKDVAGSEIQLILQSHGPAIEGHIDVQTTSYAGGCETELIPPEVPDAEGECTAIQFAVHQPADVARRGGR
jgi:hypothetical protein